jgi:hypothetical protein
MKRQRIVQKSILLLTLSIVVYFKITNPHPDWMFEIVTDAVIVFISLGLGEIILHQMLTRLSAVLSHINQTVKIKNNKQ